MKSEKQKFDALVKLNECNALVNKHFKLEYQFIGQLYFNYNGNKYIRFSQHKFLDYNIVKKRIVDLTFDKYKNNNTKFQECFDKFLKLDLIKAADQSN